MLRIKKRDGNIEEFYITKSENAIEKAFMAEHKFYNHDIIEMLALRVTSDFNRKVVNDTIGIEDVQDSVEIVLKTNQRSSQLASISRGCEFRRFYER